MNSKKPSHSAAPAGRRALRDRVLRHAHRVLATGTLAGAALLPGCSDPGVAVNQPSDGGPDAGSDAGTDAGIPDGGGYAGYDAGYVVVDPMPPPANCNDDPLTPLQASAARMASGEVRLVFSEWMYASWKLTSELHDLDGAQLVGTPELPYPTNLSVVLQPEAEATQVTFLLNLTCDDGLDHLPSSAVLSVSLQLEASPPPDAGPTPQNVTMTLLEPRDR